MESSNKKRLGVFRAITRDISPDYCAIPVPSNSFQPPPHFPNASGPLLSSDTSHVPPHSMASNSDSYFSTDSHQTAPADYSVRVCPLVKTSRDIQISRNFEQKLAQHLDPKKEFLLPFAMNKLENRYYESPLNSSGSISSRSFIMNNSTEESSREETDERRKPKKRPLEEGEKNFYVIKLDAISKGEDSRTTVMIKNIPNKYTQKMLLQTINKKFAGTYDFLYLPIDFKNRCNVGYSFINFVDFHVIEAFFHEFNAKRWEKFNSEKICALAYARIQGLQELVQHFQNSSVINQEDNKVKPIILGKN